MLFQAFAAVTVRKDARKSSRTPEPSRECLLSLLSYGSFAWLPQPSHRVFVWMGVTRCLPPGALKLDSQVSGSEGYSPATAVQSAMSLRLLSGFIRAAGFRAQRLRVWGISERRETARWRSVQTLLSSIGVLNSIVQELSQDILNLAALLNSIGLLSSIGPHFFFFSHTILRPVRARSQCSCKLRAYGALEAAASVPARIGEDLMQIRHGPLAQLGGRGQLEQRRRVGALSRDREHTGPSRDPGGDGGGLHVSGDRRHAMACEEAQELHCFGAEPAADLDADHNESTAPRALEFRVGLEALAPCSGRHCASRLHVGARVGFAASGEGGNDGGVKCKL